jgi:hypothetical protein
MFSRDFLVELVQTFTIILVFHKSFGMANFTISNCSSFERVGVSHVVQSNKIPSTLLSICICKSLSKASKSILLSIPFHSLNGVIRAVQRPIRFLAIVFLLEIYL